MLNVEKETKLRPVNACLGYKEIHTLNVSQNVQSTQSVQMFWPAFNRSVKILVLEFVVKTPSAESRTIIQAVFVILDSMGTHSHLVGELQVCLFMLY